jgi:hypothetical protein
MRHRSGGKVSEMVAKINSFLENTPETTQMMKKRQHL